MFQKTRFYSIFKFKCPRCHKGEFLESRNVYNLKKAGNIKEKCDACNLKYTREPGFYFGSMFVSYALGVALFITIWVAISVLHPGYSAELLLGLIIGSILILGPYLYALSKIIWANLFFHYEDTTFEPEKKLDDRTT